MSYARDANEIAQDAARREEAQPLGSPSVVWGTLSLWSSIGDAMRGDNPILQSNCHLDLSKPGLLITYDEDAAAEIFVLRPGQYFNFVPDRARE